MAGILFVEVLQFEKITELKEAASVGVLLISWYWSSVPSSSRSITSISKYTGLQACHRCNTGKFDNPDDPGEISHFQALTSALSATVGLGNIAGVAVAVATGGPGAVFWMIIWSRHVIEVPRMYLAQIYRG